MDLDYRVKYTDFSLEEISAIRVAKELFNSCKIKPVIYRSNKMIENDARRRLLQLNLPKHVAETVECFIRVISADVYHWPNYDLIRWCDSPIITSLGTVDLEKTLEGILSDGNVDKRTRFSLACEYSCERHVFEVGQLLTTEESNPCYLSMMSRCQVNFVTLWTQAYRYLFREQLLLGDLSQEACDRGLNLALLYSKDASVKYFVERASPEAIGAIHRRRACKDISPSTYCLLFSKMTEDQQRINMSTMSYLLLQSLLRWPYQRFFLRAARLLTQHLLVIDYFEIMAKIFLRVRKKCSDYDYKEMLVEFFELGSDHRKQMTMDPRILKLDRSFLNWLRSKMSTSENEALLLLEKKYSPDL